jgi:hypothetical protein
MNRLKTFVKLTSLDRNLLVHAFLTLTLCQARLRVHNIEKLRIWATDVGTGSKSLERLVWAIKIASRMMPGATCLCCALALQRLLARNGHRSELWIGIEKEGDRFGAHAWLLHGDDILIGDTQLELYEPLLMWQAGPSESGRTEAA